MFRLQVLLAIVACIIAPASFAHDYRIGDLEISHPFARATPPGAPVGGAYLTIDNRGRDADTLLRASSPLAASVEIHTMTHEGGVMRMRALANGLEVPPGKGVTLAPGGYHLMMMGLRKPLHVGDRVPMTLTFAKAGTLDVEVAVEAAGAMAPMQGPAMHPTAKP